MFIKSRIWDIICDIFFLNINNIIKLNLNIYKYV